MPERRAPQPRMQKHTITAAPFPTFPTSTLGLVFFLSRHTSTASPSTAWTKASTVLSLGPAV